MSHVQCENHRRIRKIDPFSDPVRPFCLPQTRACPAISSSADHNESDHASWLNKIDRKGHTRHQHVAVYARERNLLARKQRLGRPRSSRVVSVRKRQKLNEEGEA